MNAAQLINNPEKFVAARDGLIERTKISKEQNQCISTCSAKMFMSTQALRGYIPGRLAQTQNYSGLPFNDKTIRFKLEHPNTVQGAYFFHEV